MKLPGRKPKDTGATRDENGTVIAVHVGGTTIEEQMRAVFADAASVEITPGGDTYDAPDRALSPHEKQVAADAQGMGMRYDPVRKCVHLPAPDPGQNQRLFTRSEQQLTRGLNLRDTVRALNSIDGADRPTIAEYLARNGMLQPEEIAHLRWLATAENAADDVLPGTTPITPETARRIVVHILDDGHGDGSVTRVLSPPTRADMDHAKKVIAARPRRERPAGQIGPIEGWGN